MKARKDIEKRIDKEQQKITELQSQIERSESFIQGLREALKMLPRDEDTKPRKGKGLLRPGSDMAKIRDLMAQVGKPMHITQIVVGLGKENIKANRMSISGSLGRYVRMGNIFKRVGPNQFALIDMDISDSVELPRDFGAEEVPNGQSIKDDLDF